VRRFHLGILRNGISPCTCFRSHVICFDSSEAPCGEVRTETLLSGSFLLHCHPSSDHTACRLVHPHHELTLIVCTSQLQIGCKSGALPPQYTIQANHNHATRTQTSPWRARSSTRSIALHLRGRKMAASRRLVVVVVGLRGLRPSVFKKCMIPLSCERSYVLMYVSGPRRMRIRGC
jgi:hypothetical protein